MQNIKVNRVIWFPTGTRKKSSSRIQVFNIHDKLLSLGYDSIIGYEPKRTIWHLPISNKDVDRLDLQEDDLIIIQKFKKKSTVRVLQYLRKTPAQIGYIDCDAPIASKDIVDLVDFVIVPSVFLKNQYEALGVKCFTIPDCPEKYLEPSLNQKRKEKLKCVWFGNYSTSKWKEVKYFENILNEKSISNWQFDTISNTYRATKKWDKNSFSELTNYDLAVIPVPQLSLDYKVKSANRLLQSMALGIPIIASPIPSYVEIITDNGLENILCNDKEDWVKMLEYYSLLENRINSLQKNYKVAKNYNLESIIENWIDVFGIIKKSNKKTLNTNALRRIKSKAILLGYEIRI